MTMGALLPTFFVCQGISHRVRTDSRSARNSSRGSSRTVASTRAQDASGPRSTEQPVEPLAQAELSPLLRASRRQEFGPPTVEYGIRLGAVGATAAAIGFLLDLEHVGWACTAGLIVMRPTAEMQRLRSIGRIVAVATGAFVAIALARAGPPSAVYGAAAIAALAGAAGTHRSRWYVTPAFTTFLVFLLLVHGHPEEAASRFGERLLETLLGVGIAYAFGLAFPARSQRRQLEAAPKHGPSRG
jgi:uncharacterized membrane protein YccC